MRAFTYFRPAVYLVLGMLGAGLLVGGVVRLSLLVATARHERDRAREAACQAERRAFQARNPRLVNGLVPQADPCADGRMRRSAKR